MISDDFILNLVEQTLYEHGHADVAKILLLKRQGSGISDLSNILPSVPAQIQQPSCDDANQSNLTSSIDQTLSPKYGVDHHVSSSTNTHSAEFPIRHKHQKNQTADSEFTLTDRSVSWLRSSILSGDGLAEASLSAGWKNSCWDPSLVDPRVARAFHDDDNLLLVALYLIRRTSFFTKLLSLDPSHHDHKLFRLQMNDIAARDLLPLLDYLNSIKADSLIKYFSQPILEGLNRNSQSIVVEDILDLPHSSKNQLLQSEFHFGLEVPMQRSVLDLSFALNHFLLDTLLVKGILSTKPLLPPGLLKNIVMDGVKYHALRNPYLLPPRTTSPEPLYYHEMAFFANTQKKQAGLLGPMVFEPKKIFWTDLQNNEVWNCRYSPLGKWLATCSIDGEVTVYDVHNKYLVACVCRIIPEEEEKAYVVINDVIRPVQSNKAIICCCWDPSGKYLVSCGLDTIVRVWNMSEISSKYAARQSGRHRVTRSMGPAPGLGSNSAPCPQEKPLDAPLILCFCLGQDIKLWACEFLPDPNQNCVPRFVLGSPDRVLKIFDIYGNEVFDFYTNTDLDLDEAEVVESMSLIKNEGKEGLTLIDESLMDLDEVDAELIVARIIDARARTKPRPTTPSQFSRVNDLAVSPDCRFLAIVTNDCEVLVYEIPNLRALSDSSTSTLILCQVNVGKKITSCSISANGELLLLSCAPDELQVWDISKVIRNEAPYGMCVPHLYRRLLGFQQLTYIVRSSFGYLDPHTGVEQLVLSGSKDGHVCIWNLESGQLLSRSHEHNGLCNAVSWNIHGKSTGAEDYGAQWCSVGDDGAVNVYSL